MSNLIYVFIIFHAYYFFLSRTPPTCCTSSTLGCTHVICTFWSTSSMFPLIRPTDRAFITSSSTCRTQTHIATWAKEASSLAGGQNEGLGMSWRWQLMRVTGRPTSLTGILALWAISVKVSCRWLAGRVKVICSEERQKSTLYLVHSYRSNCEWWRV